MTLPTIHRNGTHPNDLLANYLYAKAAIQNAIETLLENAAPNARDYYPQGQDAISHAIDEHSLRIGKLQDVIDELNVLAEYVSKNIR